MAVAVGSGRWGDGETASATPYLALKRFSARYGVAPEASAEKHAGVGGHVRKKAVLPAKAVINVDEFQTRPT